MGLFAHLHVASGSYGTSLPAVLARQAAEMNMSALALTDRDSVAGHGLAHEGCVAHGVRPLFGVDIVVAAKASAEPVRRARIPVRSRAHVVEPPLRIALLARSAQGWARLCQLVWSRTPPGR